MGHQSVSALVVDAGEVTLQLFQNNFLHAGAETGNIAGKLCQMFVAIAA